MAKEMFIASSLHETKLAVVEDDQLVEVYFERDTDVGLVGGIYKGRVSRVLPGMQSAFVDIGLDRDAFLYVSDFFFEDQEDYDKILEEAEACAVSFNAEPAQAGVSPAPGVSQEVTPQMAAPVSIESKAPTETAPAPAPPAPAPPECEPATTPETLAAPTAGIGPAAPVSTAPSAESQEQSHFEPRGRRYRHRGRKFGEHRHAEHKFVPRQESSAPPAFEILPGESLAKYSHAAPESPQPTLNESLAAEPEAVEGEALEEADGGDFAEIVPEESASLEAPSATSAAPTDHLQIELSPEPPATSEPLTQVGTTDASAVEAGSGQEGEAGFSPVISTLPPAVARSERDVAADFSPEGADLKGGISSPYSMPATVSEDLESNDEAETVGTVEERVGLTPSAPSVDSKVQPVDLKVEDAEDSGSTSDEQSLGESARPGVGLEPSEELLAEPSSQTALPVESMPEPAAPAQNQETQVPSKPSVQAGAAESSGAPSDGTYTVREPHQRPRFAPRRGRRGRRGTNNYQGRSEPRWESRPGNNQPVQISKLLKEGQEILVQISKEPLGTKGARITSHIALPGRYLVYMPTVEHIGVSRKISSEEERLRLRNIILEHKGSLSGGFIVRTAGQGRDEEELKADLKFLSTLWNEIKAKTERAKAPALIHRDLDLVQRVLRDTLTPDFKSVRVDNEVQYERVLDFVNRSQPSLIGKVKLYTREAPLFEEFGIQSEIEKALKPKVWLKSGGYIVINQTEALVAVDVNTGKYVGKTNRLEDTILKTNFEAVNEIVRQIRLRDLGGIIVIDFIDMDERKNRAKVTQVLEEALRKDRAPTKVIAFHDFGLVAITRKRVKQSLERTLCERCSYCSGSGWVKSPTTVCYEILSEARKMAGQLEGKVMILRVNPEVAKALKSREAALVSELESLTQKEVIIKSDPVVEQERFEIF
jgi:ribonuclease G